MLPMNFKPRLNATGYFRSSQEYQDDFKITPVSGKLNIFEYRNIAHLFDFRLTLD